MGSFNPQIFQPAWFAAQEILSETEARKARIEIILADVCAFATDRVALHVDRDRFIASASSSKDYEPLRDFVIATFGLLHHSPVRQLGINLNVHFQISPEAYARIEDKLCEPEIWRSSGLPERHLQDLGVSCGRTDGRSGHINVRVQPSRRIEGSGIYLQINDHYEISPMPGSASTAQAAAATLEETWSVSVAASKRMCQALLKGASQ